MANSKKGFGVVRILGKTILLVFFMLLIYAGYIFYIIKKLPVAKNEVATLYNSIGAGFRYSNENSEKKVIQPAKNNGWTTISYKTSDSELKALEANDKQIKKVESYENILDSGSLKAINQFMELITGKKDSGILNSSELAEMKRQITQIIAASQEQEKVLKEIEMQ